MFEAYTTEAPETGKRVISLFGRLFRGKQVEEQPFRIEFVDLVNDGLAGWVGMIHVVHFPSGTSREIFTFWEGERELDTTSSRFLFRGRKGTQYDDVQPLWNKRINVPEKIKKHLKAQQDKIFRDFDLKAQNG